MADTEKTRETREITVDCPHCHKPFDASVVQGKGRIRGFKCPHCRLFVPYDRVAEQTAS